MKFELQESTAVTLVCALAVITFIVCVTIFNITPMSCFAEMRPSCVVVQGTVHVYDNECLATVARACSGG